MPVDAGVAETLVDLREAGGIVVAIGTHAGEAVGAVDTRAAVVARVEGALVYVDVTHGTWNRERRRVFFFPPRAQSLQQIFSDFLLRIKRS